MGVVWGVKWRQSRSPRSGWTEVVQLFFGLLNIQVPPETGGPFIDSVSRNKPQEEHVGGPLIAGYGWFADVPEVSSGFYKATRGLIF